MMCITLLFLANCTNHDIIKEDQETEHPKVNPIRITPDQAKEMMNDENVIILDVRTQDEFDAGHIENAVLLPYDDILSQHSMVFTNKNQIILIYCRTGRRSWIAATQLVELGYTSVYDFGGIIDWQGTVVTS